jgi:hypothetical protein
MSALRVRVGTEGPATSSSGVDPAMNLSVSSLIIWLGYYNL